MSDMTIKQLVEITHQNAIDKGFANPEKPRPVPEMLMLLVSEAAEALEADRNRGKEPYFELKIPAPEFNEIIRTMNKLDAKKTVKYLEEKAKFVDPIKEFKEEIGDIFIRLGDTCGEYGIDIEAEIKEKMEKNFKRPQKHGKIY